MKSESKLIIIAAIFALLGITDVLLDYHLLKEDIEEYRILGLISLEALLRGLMAITFPTFGITFYYVIKKGRQARAVLDSTAKGISEVTGDAFFRSLVEYLAKTLGADYAFVGEVPKDWSVNKERGAKAVVKTIAVMAGGKIVDNFEYELADTPCENVVGNTMCSYPHGVQQLFPKDLLLVDMKVESYIGTPLFDSRARPIGLLVVLSTKPLADPKAAETLLLIFAGRAAAEMERRNAENTLQVILEGTAGVFGEDFFQSLVRLLATELRVRSAVVTEMLEGHRARILAHWSGGEFGPAEEYSLTGTPGEIVLKGEPLVFPSKVQESFPDDEVLCKVSAESYLGIPLFNTSGTVIGHLCLLHDQPMEEGLLENSVLRIFAARAGAELERKQAEEKVRKLNEALEMRVVERTIELRDSEARYRDLLENANDLIVSFGSDGAFHYLNGAFRDALGYSEKELAELTFWEVIHPNERPQCRYTVQAIAEGKQTGRMETVFLTKTGETVQVEGNLNYSFKDGKPQASRGIFRDISSRKRAEAISRQALQSTRAAEMKYRGLLESAPDAILTVGRDGRIQMVNNQVEKLFGYGREELLGKPVEMLIPERFRKAHDESRKLYSGSPRIRPMGEDRDLKGLHKDGSEFPVEISLSPLETEEGLLVSGIIRDITERVQAKQKLEEFAHELERSNQELQDFASVAAHDLQEPLRKVQVFCGRVETKWGTYLPKEGRDYLNRMQKAGERMQALVTNLLELSRVTTRGKEFVSVDLNQVVREVLTDLELKLEQSGGRVEVEELPRIKADPTQMRQLLQNLLINALKFCRKGKSPQVRIQAYSLNGTPNGPRYETGNGAGPNGRKAGDAPFCRISVEDKGIGFDEKYLDRIFQVFQRLHGRGTYEGTGMGLAVCRKIAERHGGSITARSKPGEGATFLVTLPVEHSRKKVTQ